MPTPLTTCLLGLAGVTTAVSGPVAIGIAGVAVVWQVLIQARTDA